MKRRFLRSLILAAPLSLALTGCQSAMSSSPTSTPDPSDGSYSNVNPEWPLKFRAHYFDAYCYSTYGCKVLYRGMLRADDPDDVLQLSSESLGSRYPDNLSAGMGPIPNFPPPAKVTWRSRDGTPHEAEIDIGEIFKDQLIRHNVAREDATDIPTSGMPGIVLEVNDRTINIYMRAMIATKELQKPGNRHSDFRNDLIKVFSQSY